MDWRPSINTAKAVGVVGSAPVAHALGLTPVPSGELAALRTRSVGVEPATGDRRRRVHARPQRGQALVIGAGSLNMAGHDPATRHGRPGARGRSNLTPRHSADRDG
jgi:hypothetical protein